MNRKLIKINIILWFLVLVIAVAMFVSHSRGSYGISSRFPYNFGTASGAQFVVAKDVSIKNDINDVSVDWISGNVDILKSENNEIKIVQFAGEKFPDNELFSYKIKGKKLSVTDERKGKINIGFKFNNISNGSDLKIYLPEREFNSIKIDTVSSNISSKSLNTEILTLITISGDIALSGEFPEIYLKTVSGNLQAEELDVQRITLETTSGEISLTGSLTELDINTISGDAKIYSSSMIKNIKSNAVSGNVTIAIPDNDGFTVDFSKVSGKLKSGFALTTNGNTHIYKNGKTKFSANSVSGNFEIIKNQ
jgi:lia operon protein LiaG